MIIRTGCVPELFKRNKSELVDNPAAVCGEVSSCLVIRLVLKSSHCYRCH